MSDVCLEESCRTAKFPELRSIYQENDQLVIRLFLICLPLQYSSCNPASIDVSATTQTGNIHHPFNCWNIGQKIKGVTKQQRLSIGDGVHDGQIGVGLSFVLDLSDVTDSETIEKVHEDNHDQDDKGEEVQVT